MVDGCKNRNIMKKFISALIFATVVAFGLVSCSKTDPNLAKISGEWYWNNTEAGVDMEVYVAFHTDATFDLYQKLGEGAFRHYTGTYTFDGETLKGIYSDKTAWAHDYIVTISGNNLTMKYVGEEVSITYVKKTIPFTVRHHHTEPLKSMADDYVPFL
jgi:hypothetical protein